MTAPHVDPAPGPAPELYLGASIAEMSMPRSRSKSSRLNAEKLLEGLNPPQREAVLHEGAPVLVVAGAGSGKTRVLTRRVAYLVSERRVHPGSILAITFTNKAAAEMRGRVMDLVGNRAKLMWVSTFHSACVRILRSEIARFGMSRTFSIYDDADSKRLMQLVAGDLDLDPKRFPVRGILNWVSACKNELVDHESAGARVRSPAEESYAAAYGEYQRRLIAANALDFDDLIMTTVHLLQAFPDLREQYRRRFRHVLVDEYQDTNHAQYALIRELCSAEVAGLPESVRGGQGGSSPPQNSESVRGGQGGSSPPQNSESVRGGQGGSSPPQNSESVRGGQGGSSPPQNSESGHGGQAGSSTIPPPELMVVGDSDQSIYAFRGATIRNINDFDSDFPGARVILLEQNYRSTQTI